MVNPKLVIFGALAVGAAVGAAVAAAWAGYKTAEIVREKEIKTKKETVKETWKYWMPSVACLGVAIVSDVCLFKFGMGAAAALSGVVAYCSANRRTIEKKLKSFMDSKEFKEFKKDVTKETVKEVYKFSDIAVDDTGYGKTLCYFKNINKYIRSDPMEVQKAISNLKWGLTHGNKEYLFLDFCDDLHIGLHDFERMAYDDMGWVGADIDDEEGVDNLITCDMTEGWIPNCSEACYIIEAWIEPYFIRECPRSKFAYAMI